MMAFLFALVAVVGIGFGASVVLDQYQRTADSAYKTTGVRLEPEHRLHDKPMAKPPKT